MYSQDVEFVNKSELLDIYSLLVDQIRLNIIQEAPSENIGEAATITFVNLQQKLTIEKVKYLTGFLNSQIII